MFRQTDSFTTQVHVTEAKDIVEEVGRLKSV